MIVNVIRLIHPVSFISELLRAVVVVVVLEIGVGSVEEFVVVVGVEVHVGQFAVGEGGGKRFVVRWGRGEGGHVDLEGGDSDGARVVAREPGAICVKGGLSGMVGLIGRGWLGGKWVT